MPLSSQAPIIQPRVNDLVSAPESAPVVTPSATVALTDAFRQGFITSQDVLDRVGQKAQLKEKVEIQAAQEALSPEAIEARQVVQKATAAKAKADILKSGMDQENAQLDQKARRAKTILDIANSESFGTFEPMRNSFLALGIPVPSKDGSPDTEAMKAEMPQITAYANYIRNADAIAKSVHKQKFVQTVGKQTITSEADFSDALNRPITDAERQAISDAKSIDYMTWKNRNAPKNIFGAAPGQTSSIVSPAVPAQSGGRTFAGVAVPGIQEIMAETPEQRQARIDALNSGNTAAFINPKEASALPRNVVTPAAPAPTVKPEIQLGGHVAGVPGVVTESVDKTPADDPGRLIPAEAMSKFVQLRLARDNISDVANAYNELKKNAPGLIGVVKGRTVGPLLGEWNVFYKRLENAVQSTVPGMARGVFGEVGVLSDNDIKNYKQLLPNAKQDPAVAEAILQDIQTKVNRAAPLFISTFKDAGYNVGDLETAVANTGPAAQKSSVGGTPVFTLSTGKKVQRNAQGVLVEVP